MKISIDRRVKMVPIMEINGNRCEQFGPNGLTDYPCKRIPSRNCPWFIKISDKRYKKILADRVKRIKENEKLKQEMMKDQDLVEEVKQNTKRLMQ